MSKLLDYLYYDVLPEVYREEDDKNEKQLYRYLQSLDEGGLQKIKEEIDGLEDVIDIERCPSEFLPFWSRMLGFEYDQRYPDKFLRRLLKDIGRLYKMKGTNAVVKYISRELARYEVEIEETPSATGDSEILLRLFILSENYLEQELSVPKLNELMYHLVNQFLPYQVVLQVLLNFKNTEVRRGRSEDIDKEIILVQLHNTEKRASASVSAYDGSLITNENDRLLNEAILKGEKIFTSTDKLASDKFFGRYSEVRNDNSSLRQIYALNISNEEINSSENTDNSDSVVSRWFMTNTEKSLTNGENDYSMINRTTEALSY
jgi:phage tail-like protein